MKKKFQDIKVITILFINFLPTAQSLSLYAQLIQEITSSTSLSMQILQVWASSIRRFSFCNHRGCCTFGDLPIYRHLKSSSYTLEVLGLLKIFKSSSWIRYMDLSLEYTLYFAFAFIWNEVSVIVLFPQLWEGHGSIYAHLEWW